MNTAEIIHVYPVVGDNWANIKAAMDYQIATPGCEVVLGPGLYPISKPLIFYRIVNGQYAQVTPRLRGPVSARNCPTPNRANILFTGTDSFAMGVQLGKGGYIKDIALIGQYTFPNTLTPLQIDMLSDSDWNVGVRSNPVTPYAGLAIDPFSDPAALAVGVLYPGLESNYIPGMSRSGSTAVMTSGLCIQNFLVGMITTPSNQQNGELIHLHHSQIDYCKTAYAICQAQSKQNEVVDLECWGHTRTVYDNMSYGVRHGDGAGSPVVYGTNLAGNIHEVFNISNYAFQGSYYNIYGETLTKIGRVGGNAGAKIDGMQISFSSADPGRACPDLYLDAYNVQFLNCILRFYSESGKYKRFPLNGQNNYFLGGQVNAPPQIAIYGGSPVSYPTITGMVMYALNGVINTSHYDVFTWLTVTTVHINADRSGWCDRGGTNQRGDFTKIKPNDLLITEVVKNGIHSYNTPLGFVTKIENDILYFENAGVDIVDGQQYVINDFQWQLP